MINIIEQIRTGQLVCPKTKQRLSPSSDNSRLENAEGTLRYAFLRSEVPILLMDPKWAEEYSAGSTKMNEEYDINAVNKKITIFARIRSVLTQDYRTEQSKKAFLGIFEGLSDHALCLSIGGGPVRNHPKLTNLNIGPFPNVDVVADAHFLPYTDGCVDAVHSEAVFEHLYDPVKAAAEIYRVLKPGKKAYICTPFMQAYHGYPHHYQNFTITGHKHLFESVGFKIVQSGSCVGPVYTMVSLLSTFLNEYPPRPLNSILRIIWGGIGVFIRPLDIILGNSNNAYVLASTTYVVVEK